LDLLTQLLLLLVLALGVITVGVCVFLLWGVPKLEHRLVFRPSKDVTQTPISFGVPFEHFFVPTPDGERLSAWHLLPEHPRAAVLYFHGNSGNLGLFAGVLTRLYQNRLQVFAIDYRGYGRSSGQPTEKGVYMDALAAVEYFHDRLRLDGCPVVFWGRSLGGPVAAYASSQASPGGVILETTFSSKRVLLRNYPWQFRIFSVFSKYRFDTLRHLSGQSLHKLVVHGDQDRTIPVEQGRYLFRNLESPKSLLVISGADHINIHEVDEDRYWGKILGFIERL